MSADVISIVALAAIFAIAIFMSVNMGLLAFAAAFLVGTLAADMTADDIFGVFPGDIFVVLVGITYLFAIAQRNGTVDWLVNLAMRAVGGRVGAIPWIMFAIAGVLTAIGAVSPAAVAIVAPIALGFAVQFGINPLLMGIMVGTARRRAASRRSACTALSSTTRSPTPTWHRASSRCSSRAWCSTPSWQASCSSCSAA